MEFYKEGVLTAVNFNKNGSEIGKQKFKNPLKTPCFFRVDTESVYETECFIGDDEELYAIGLVENINEDLLNQFKSGSKRRIKIAPYESQTEPLYLRFSLKGFSAAYKRALELQMRTLSSLNKKVRFIDNSERSAVKVELQIKSQYRLVYFGSL